MPSDPMCPHRSHAVVPFLPILSLLLALGSMAQGSERSIGVVSDSQGERVVITTFPGPLLQPGTLVSLYGPGPVQRHPLTNEVVVEERKLVAKAIIESLAEQRAEARIIWRQGAVAAGFDAIHRGGPRPNGAPQRVADAATAQRLDSQGNHAGVASNAIPAQSTVLLSLPVQDPDGDALFFRWRIEGQQPGHLHQQRGSTPLLGWTAPAVAGTTVTLIGTAIDPWGAHIELRETLRTADPITTWNRRNTFLAAQRSNADPLMLQHILLRDGRALALGRDGLIYRQQGWFHHNPFPFAEGERPSRAQRLRVTADGGFLVLNGQPGEAYRYSAGGTRVAVFAGLRSPVDILPLTAGAVAISDPGEGGIHIFAADGSYLARLGRSSSPGPLAAHADGRFMTIDGGNQLQEYDPWWRPLRRWSIPLDGGHSVIDLAYQRGAQGQDLRLILLSDGSLRRYSADGLLLDTINRASEHPVAQGSGRPSTLSVAPDGHITIAFAESGRLLRLDREGAFVALREGIPRSPRFAISSGLIWVADASAGTISTWNSEGWTIAKRPLPEGLRELSDFQVSPDGSTLAILDRRNAQVHLLDARDARQAPISFGSSGRERGQFRSATAIALDDEGRSYVLDSSSNKVAVFANDGRLLMEFAESGREPHQLRSPALIAVSPDGSSCAIYDGSDYLIKRYALDHAAASASHLGNVGGRGSGPGQLRSASGIGIDRLGLLYVSDSSRGDVQIWDVRGGNAVTVHHLDTTSGGVPRMDGLAVGSDGILLLHGREQIAIHHW